MKYLSVCSGIEAASVAWEPLGWEPVALSEIEPFPAAVLKHRWPKTPNLGDMTKYEQWNIPSGSVDLLVGGTPCQSFSVAGLRKGLHDPRGGLMLTFLEIARSLRPRWVVWENVPGVLSSNGGRDFGSFLGALGGLGYGWAYRVLDAQYTRVDGYPGAVPQRRRRVFVVGCAGGDFSRAAAVLLEPEGVRGNPPTRRASRKGVAADAAGGFEVCGTLSDGAHHGGGLNGQDAYTGRIQPVTFAAPAIGAFSETQVAGTLMKHNGAGPGETQNCAYVAFDTYNHATSDVSQTIKSPSGGANESVGTVMQAMDVMPMKKIHGSGGAGANRNAIVGKHGDPMFTLDVDSRHGVAQVIAPTRTHTTQAMAVRRLTPVECERLQGFPDDYTRIPWKKKSAEECPDGGRYKALGNSMAVNCMRWIGRRIELVEQT